jgi:hypothetical protein
MAHDETIVMPEAIGELSSKSARIGVGGSDNFDRPSRHFLQ